MGAPLADFVGRKYALGIMGLVFMVGAALQEVPILSAMYAGRFLAGLAIGATSMVCEPLTLLFGHQLTMNASFLPSSLPRTPPSPSVALSPPPTTS